MKTNQYRVDLPFDATWTITVYGRTQGDGKVYTMTSQIIRDKVGYFLDLLVKDGKIHGYNISNEINNLESAKETIRRSKKK